MFLSFGPIASSDLPTSHLLNAVFRLHYPTRSAEPADDDLAHDAESVLIKRALEKFPDEYEPLPFQDDPVMVAGHSLLAILAAWFGGVAAPLVAGACRRRAARDGR
jgi:hypothetical protein